MNTPPVSVIFESRDEAIRAICEKVFGAVPSYPALNEEPAPTKSESPSLRDLLDIFVTLTNYRYALPEATDHRKKIDEYIEDAADVLVIQLRRMP